MSIRAQLFLLVFLAVLPLVALTSVRYLSDRDRGIETAELELRNIADDLSRDITGRIQGTAQLLYGLSRTEEVRRGGRGACSQFLADVARAYPVYSNLAAFYGNGDSYRDALRSEGLNIADRPYFQAAANGHVTAQAVVSRLSGRPIVSVAYPVFSDEDGFLSLLFVGGLDLEVVVRSHYPSTAPPDMQIVLVGQAGEVSVWLPRDGGTPPHGSLISDTVLAAFTGEQTSLTTEDGNRRQVWAAASVAGVTNGNLYVLVGTSHAGLTADADRRLTQDLAILAAAVAFLMLVAMVLAESGVRQLGRIHAVVRRLRRGDLTARLTGTYPRGELGQLMYALNSTVTQFAMLIESSPAAMVCVDRDGQIMLWNAAAAALLERPTDHVLGQNVANVGNAFGPLLQQSLERVLAGTALDSTELAVPTVGNGERTVSLRGAPVQEPNGIQPVGAVFLLIDVTERRDLQKQLFQAQKLDALGQLTGGIAHDFNNLLTAIIGNSALLLDRVTGDEGSHDLAESTLMAARHGADLTKRLLAFAKQQALAPKIVDIADLLSKMHSLLQRTLGTQVLCVLQPTSGLDQAMVDPGQLESAILNLAVNARDAMPSGGRLTIRATNEVVTIDGVEREVVQVSVIDTGVGMSEATLARVLEPFFTTKTNGTGLGIPMVYGFARQSGGDLQITSAIGKGTTVNLLLPRARKTAREEESPAYEVRYGNGEMILLVEDDGRVRRYATIQLKALGYRVIAVANAADALKVLGGTTHLDLLLTDLMLPGGLNGDQLADEAQRLRPDLATMFVSGSPDAAARLAAGRGKNVAFLAKPYEPFDLAQFVRTVLDAAHPAV